MALDVEDGTGKSTSESYVSLASFVAYCDKMGYVLPTATDAVKEGALRRATMWLDANFRARLPGAKLRGRAQALEWPRSGAVDAAGDDIDEDAVPAEVQSALCESARREITSPGSLAPDYVAAQRVTSESVDVIKTTYADEGGVDSSRPILTVVDDIMSSILVIQHGNPRTAFLLRA